MPAIQQETVTVKGELTAYRVMNGDGWGVGALRPAGAAESVPVVGKLVGARVGDTVELSGTWTEHPRFGRQLKVRACNTARPDDGDGIVKWLASRLPDVGEGRARALVERFGAQLWDVIEQTPEALAQVPGITAARAEAINAAYVSHKAERDHMIALRGWGLTDSQVARCIEAWKCSLGEAVERVRQNPYALSQCVYGFGFKRADLVATKMGIAHDAPERIRAGVEWSLDEASSDKGHCYVAGAALQRAVAELLGVSFPAVAAAIKDCAAAGRIIRRDWRIYTQRMDVAERQCADALRRLLGRAA
jgi:exodeoxyribonuclease V alpha subunit